MAEFLLPCLVMRGVAIEGLDWFYFYFFLYYVMWWGEEREVRSEYVRNTVFFSLVYLGLAIIYINLTFSSIPCFHFFFLFFFCVWCSTLEFQQSNIYI